MRVRGVNKRNDLGQNRVQNKQPSSKRKLLKLLKADAPDPTKALTIARGIEISNTQMKDLTKQNKAVHEMYKDKHEKKTDKIGTNS